LAVFYIGRKGTWRWTNAQSCGVAGGERNDRRAGVDHKLDAAAVDAAIDVKMAAAVARDRDRTRAR
jgi:hypothetical protein